MEATENGAKQGPAAPSVGERPAAAVLIPTGRSQRQQGVPRVERKGGTWHNVLATRSAVVDSFIRRASGGPGGLAGRAPCRAAARVVCFPFRAGYHRRGPGAPLLSPLFTDDERWRAFAVDCLVKRMLAPSCEGQAESAVWPACQVQALPRAASRLPHVLTDVLTLTEVLSPAWPNSAGGGNATSPGAASLVYRATIAPAPPAPCHGRLRDCVVKAVPLPPEPSGILESRTRQPGPAPAGWAHLCCATAWCEAVALAKVYPLRFLGAALVFETATRRWHVIIVMPLYRGTLWDLVDRVLPLYGKDGAPAAPKSEAEAGAEPGPRRQEREAHGGGGGGCGWPQVLLAALAQVLLYTLPRAKRAHLVAHNDLKLDNVAYRRTSKRFVFVRIRAAPDDRPPLLLAVPTYGRLFYLIDFEWASFVCPHERLCVSSAAPRHRLACAMRVWNAATDAAQVAYSLWYKMQRDFGRGPLDLFRLDAAWWDLLNALCLVASTDDSAPGVLVVTHANWEVAFYSAISRRCHLQRVERLVAFMHARYACPPDAVPPSRVVIEYDARRVLRQCVQSDMRE
jgi:hypothetical protein